MPGPKLTGGGHYNHVCEPCPDEASVFHPNDPSVEYVIRPCCVLCEGRKGIVVGEFHCAGVGRVIRSHPVRARRRLTGTLRRRNVRIARTAISHSVGRLVLVGIPADSNRCHCTLSPRRGVLVSGGHVTHLFRSSVIHISSTCGRVVIRALPNSTGPVTTTVSRTH